MTNADKLDALIFRTPAADCPGCKEKRLHTRKETEYFHPLSGHGYKPEDAAGHICLDAGSEVRP